MIKKKTTEETIVKKPEKITITCVGDGIKITEEGLTFVDVDKGDDSIEFTELKKLSENKKIKVVFTFEDIED